MKSCTAILLLTISTSVFADSYVDGSKPLIQIESADQQAQAWATCAAAYDIISAILKTLEQPAQSQQMRDFGHGAQLAVGMTLVVDDLTPDITKERFALIWTLSQAAMKNYPEVKRTGMLADAERLGKDGYGKFVDDIAATVKICVSNLEAQQAYIDTWRELAKSGLLEFPEN